MQLDGMPAIVTGAASGLGAEVARDLGRSGARVALLDLDRERAEAVAQEIDGLAFGCDVTSETDVVGALDAVHERLGDARILVNCAGIGPARRVLGRDGPIPIEAFDAVVRVNLLGTFNMIRLAAARMAALDPLDDGERGAIVSTASVAAYEGQIGQAAYSASKGGIVAMTLPLAREFARFGIRVLAVAPGIFRTPLVQSLPEEAQQRLAEDIPFPNRLGQPSEFADLVRTCITNRYLNGEVIRIDGATRLAPR